MGVRRFAVRQIATGETWTGRTGRDEICLVLLSGLAWVTWSPGSANVRGSAPGGTCSPTIRTPFTCRLAPRSRWSRAATPKSRMSIARDQRVPAEADPAAGLRPGGTRRRQRHAADHRHSAARGEGDRLLVCEVLTPAGELVQLSAAQARSARTADRSGSRREVLLPVQR